jgi:hypothetical protein
VEGGWKLKHFILWDNAWTFGLKQMKFGGRTSETSVSICHTTRRNIPEDIVEDHPHWLDAVWNTSSEISRQYSSCINEKKPGLYWLA